MADGVYLRPLGFLYGRAADQAAADGLAGRLGGRPLAFTQLEVIEGAPGSTRSQIRSFGELRGSRDDAVRARLGRITGGRPAVSGLALDHVRLMGVLNVTPDSFSDGGLFAETEAALAHAVRLARDGADIIDIGGESTRPGSESIDIGRELERVVPVIEGLRPRNSCISIDTRKPAVMKAAAAAGAHMLNDVTALEFDTRSLAVAAGTGLPVILMHARGDPRTMQDDPFYEDVLLEVYDYLEARIVACEAAGIPRDRLIADPGIGFGKTVRHNLTLLAGIGLLHGLGVALLLGASRKRFIGALADAPEPRNRAPGSIAAALAGVAQGVQIVRIHDVGATRQALSVWQAAVGIDLV